MMMIEIKVEQDGHGKNIVITKDGRRQQVGIDALEERGSLKIEHEDSGFPSRLQPFLLKIYGGAR